jgi:hypothetical protein
MDGENAMPYPGVSRSESPPKNGVMVIERQKDGGPIVPEYRGEAEKNGWIKVKPCNPRQHGSAALHDLCSDFARSMQAEHARFEAMVGKAVSEGLDHFLGPPRDEGGGEYVDSKGLFRKRHCGNRQR